ncbi:hypothetical protein [uncultured Desulfobacter sp.]|uniref:hypothetical protein n=1 Tax=uncultured Desulfobacter sp. TaxID=240139 RepID=UPI002AA86D86|nr:hypothetical protein [uncultured Desulfobacter sp.]
MLYKYLPPERIDVLSNLRIRFSQPRSLNDPFETAPLINFDGKAALVEFAEKKFHDFWDSCPSEMQTEENKREFEKTLKASANRNCNTKLTPLDNPILTPPVVKIILLSLFI